MTFLMYCRSLSPRLEYTSSWMASNSLAICSRSSSLRCASGLCGSRVPVSVLSMLLVTTPPASKPVASLFYFDVTLRGVDAGTHRSPGGLAHLVGPQVPELPGFQRADARVEDADTAAVRQLQAGVLACGQDGCSPVALHLFLAVEEVDGAALAAPGIPTDDRLETFEVESFG